MTIQWHVALLVESSAKWWYRYDYATIVCLHRHKSKRKSMVRLATFHCQVGETILKNYHKIFTTQVWKFQHGYSGSGTSDQAYNCLEFTPLTVTFTIPVFILYCRNYNRAWQNGFLALVHWTSCSKILPGQIAKSHACLLAKVYYTEHQAVQWTNS